MEGPREKPSEQDDNQQKFKPEDMTPDPGFRESGPNPGHSGGSQVLSPLRDPRSTILNYTNKLLIHGSKNYLQLLLMPVYNTIFYFLKREELPSVISILLIVLTINVHPNRSFCLSFFSESTLERLRCSPQDSFRVPDPTGHNLSTSDNWKEKISLPKEGK